MSKSPIVELDQDYVILNTSVTVGKSYSSKGWALSRQDIHDWIPVEEFERDCKVIINDICSDAILRFNPRLFYDSDELSLYLKELYDNGWRREKIPIGIKISKDSLFSNINSIEEYLELEFINMELGVGKAYRSKCWRLSEEVISKIFPLKEFGGICSIYVDGIEYNAKLNFGVTVCYNDDKLSAYLEKLYYINRQEKIFPKIIFDINEVSRDVKNYSCESNKSKVNCFKRPFEAYSGSNRYIFVSYAHKDSYLVFPEIKKFHDRGYPIWYDQGLTPGQEWDDEVAKALLGCSLLIVFISHNSMNSNNVQDEVRLALKRKIDIVPIFLEEMELPPAFELRLSNKHAIFKFMMDDEDFLFECLKAFDKYGISK